MSTDTSKSNHEHHAGHTSVLRLVLVAVVLLIRSSLTSCAATLELKQFSSVSVGAPNLTYTPNFAIKPSALWKNPTAPLPTNTWYEYCML